MSTKDQMQDAFPVVFDFVKGEQPADEKLTGLVKHTNTAFSRITKAMGDPWDYQHHTDDLKLSLENLAQSSIARIIGPSDYLSPTGASFNETSWEGVLITASLKSHRNSWDLGYPLVKLTTPCTETSTVDDISPLVWETDVTIHTDTGGIFTTRVTDPKEVDADGKFYVDFYAGRIISYEPSSSTIVLYIANLYMLSAGPPWSTHNVIPTWEQTVGLCDVAKVGTVGSLTQYTLTFPNVNDMPRFGTSVLKGGCRDYNSVLAYDTTFGYDVTYSGISVPGEAARYRVPAALTTAGLTIGTELPEGYCNLWDDVLGRVVPSVTFQYKDENSFTLWTPEDWLEEGDGKYRVITSGTSIAEAINYLTNTVRDNRHTGLVSSGSVGDKNLRYTQPIDHWTLSGLHTGYIADVETTDLWKFRTSTMPTNPHPQYLHRAGYNEYDLEGNSANAMRGELVFSAIDTYDLGAEGNSTETYGVWFGGATTSLNARLRFEGGRDLVTWSPATIEPADKFYFGTNSGVMATYCGAVTFSPYKGSPFYIRGKDIAYGVPEQYEYAGATIGFDLARSAEFNYVKLLPANRSGDSDIYNQPAYYEQDNTTVLPFTPDLTSTTGAFQRLGANQLREFRFRGGAYIPDALNINDGIGHDVDSNLKAGFNTYAIVSANATLDKFNIDPSVASPNCFIVGRSIVVSGATANNGIYIIDHVVQGLTFTEVYTTTSLVTGTGGQMTMYSGEHDAYFVSPSVIGCDFLNVYSNAIFFSDTGDGKTTSLTDHAEEYFDDITPTKIPTGLYYLPKGFVSTGFPCYSFAHFDSAGTTSNVPLAFGYEWGLTYNGIGDISLTTSVDVSITSGDNFTLIAEDDIFLTTAAGTATLGAYGGFLEIGDTVTLRATHADQHALYLQSTSATGDIFLASGRHILMETVRDIQMSSDGVLVQASDDILIQTSDWLRLRASSGAEGIRIEANYGGIGYLYLFGEGIHAGILKVDSYGCVYVD